MAEPATIQRARDLFPRGLNQPPGSFRFSADALLLAAFILRRCLPGNDGAALLDLGCGCGVVGLACLLGRESLAARGLDVGQDLVTAARDNAGLLGFASRYGADVLDLADQTDRARIRPGAYAVVAANMPYRDAGSGRAPRTASRRRALFADAETIPSFMAAAGTALAPGGVFALVYPWDGRERLLNSLAEHGFSADIALPVRMARKGASRVLIRAVRTGNVVACPVRYEPELALHAPPEAGGTDGYSREALAFCPWIGSGRVRSETSRSDAASPEKHEEFT